MEINEQFDYTWGEGVEACNGFDNGESQMETISSQKTTISPELDAAPEPSDNTQTKTATDLSTPVSTDFVFLCFILVHIFI